MKKRIVVFVTSLVLIAAVAIPVAMAAPEDSKTSKFFESMFDLHQKSVEQSVEKGEITEEEAQQYNEHFDVMEKYHQENGAGHCGGATDPGNGPSNQSYRSQFNGGMMRGTGGMMNGAGGMMSNFGVSEL